MQIFESLLSLLVFVSLLALFVPPVHHVDDSLYRMQVANDIWRMFYLRGDLEGFDKLKMNADAAEITRLTGLCIELEEEDVTSCIPTKDITQIQRTAMVNGKPKIITMRVGLGTE